MPSPAFWRGRRVAVTGATGFVGSHLVAMLVDLGADVGVLVRDEPSPRRASRHWFERVHVVRGRVDDTATAERFLAGTGAQTVVHLAAQTRPAVTAAHPVGTFESTIAGTWSVLEAARRSAQPPQVLVAGCDRAYGHQDALPYAEDLPLQPRQPHDVATASADLLATSYGACFGLPVIVCRFPTLFGPGDLRWDALIPGTVRDLLAGRPPRLSVPGNPSRDYLYVVDAAAAFFQTAEHLAAHPEVAGEALNFSVGRPVAVRELVQMLQIAAGTSFEVEMPEVDDDDDGEHRYLSAAKARQLLGWTPGHTIEEAVILTVGWYQRELGSTGDL